MWSLAPTEHNEANSTEKIVYSFTLSDWSLCTWSWIRDLRGEITNVTPAPMSPVSWKHRLFPPPVGISIKQSCFIIAAFMASSWFVLNERMLYTLFNIFHISLWYGKSFRFNSTAKCREINEHTQNCRISSHLQMPWLQDKK